MDIKVLGPGCAKCKKTEELVKEAVTESGVDAQIEKVTDLMKSPATGYSAPLRWWWTVRSSAWVRSRVKKKLHPGLQHNDSAMALVWRNYR